MTTDEQIRQLRERIEKRLEYIRWVEKLGSSRDVEYSANYLAEDEQKLRRLVMNGKVSR